MTSLVVQLQIVLVLVCSLVVLRGIGWLGVRQLSTWRAAGLGAVAIVFLVTSSAHFNGMKYDLAAMLPADFPGGLGIIYLTGVFEIAGAIGLLVPRTRRLAGICLVLLLAALFPANVYAALNGISLSGEPPTPLWLRAPEQLLYVGMVWWTAISAQPMAAGRRPNRENIAEHKQAFPGGATS